MRVLEGKTKRKTPETHLRRCRVVLLGLLGGFLRCRSFCCRAVRCRGVEVGQERLQHGGLLQGRKPKPTDGTR